ncbi:hypothetical protein J6590_079506 [Homalodisca vitripennis]|nr:hypothetical protein J6590_079506 [Homalodisca vitripennis]
MEKQTVKIISTKIVANTCFRWFALPVCVQPKGDPSTFLIPVTATRPQFCFATSLF